MVSPETLLELLTPDADLRRRAVDTALERVRIPAEDAVDRRLLKLADTLVRRWAIFF